MKNDEIERNEVNLVFNIFFIFSCKKRMLVVRKRRIFFLE